jgi:uncharacterized repeat protein (TIGR02543 family)
MRARRLVHFGAVFTAAALMMAALVLAGCEDLGIGGGGDGDGDGDGALSYTVTFHANGGSGTAPAAQTVVYGSGIILPAGDALSKTGHVFGGWNAIAGGTVTTYSAMSQYAPSTNVTLYAKWTAIPYTVTFNANGGSPAPQTLTVNYGASAGTLPTAPEKTGYNFGGWYTAQNGGGTQFDASTAVSGSITVYAKWTANPTGTITAEFTGPRDETITLSGAQDLSWSANTALTVSVSGSFSAYRWALDGAILAGKTQNTLTLRARDLSITQHTLTAVVTKNGVEYTKRMTFKVAQ